MYPGPFLLHGKGICCPIMRIQFKITPTILTVFVLVLMAATFSHARDVEELFPRFPRATELALTPYIHQYMQGTGEHDVLMISDPFCGYCRRAYAHLLHRSDTIKSVRILHLPLDNYPGSDVAVLLIRKFAKTDHLPEFLTFAHAMELPPKELDMDKARGFTFQAFQGEFPQAMEGLTLETLIAEGLAEVKEGADAAISLGFTGTPHIIVDGYHLKGYSRNGLEILLTE